MSSKYNAKPILLIGGIIILAAIITIWFFNNFEYKEIDKSTGYSKQARKNDFLAAELFLKEFGLNVVSNGNRAKLLDTHNTNKTILLNNYGPKLSPTHFNKLKEWLNNGGHLIMKANEPLYTFFNIEIEEEDIKHNQLLEEYGVYAAYVDYSESETQEETDAELDEDGSTEHEYETDIDASTEITLEQTHETEDKLEAECECCDCEEEYKATTYTQHDDTAIDIEFNSGYYLFDPDNHASYKLEDEYGINLLQIKIGEGLITVLSDNSIFKNYAIENYDHAFLLTQLININASNGGDILLLYSTVSDSVFTLLWRHAKQLCIAFLCMLFIALWSMYNRIGPIVPLTSYNNRNIIEHLKAIARFSYRQDRGKYLLHKSRIACEQFFISRYPALKNMSTQERVDHLSEVLDINHSTIHLALYTEPKSTYEYINSSHQLQKLWILK